MAKPTLRSTIKASYLLPLLGLIACNLPFFVLTRPSLSSTITPPEFTLAAKFNPPPGTERPTGSESGGNRGCGLKSNGDKNAIQRPILLVPQEKSAADEKELDADQKKRISRVSLTTSAYPTFFVYVPDTTNQEVKFSLLEYDQVNKENGREIYQTRFFVNRNPGVISISLPANANFPPLQVGKKYHWYFSLICDASEPSGDVTEEEFIERIPLNSKLASKLEKATLREKFDLYAEAGIWQDTLTVLAQLRRENPNDSALKAEWVDLLDSVALEQVAKEPLIMP